MQSVKKIYIIQNFYQFQKSTIQQIQKGRL